MTDVLNPPQGTPPAPPVPLRPLGKVMAITSGKGGVGKTFVSANPAAALAKRGHRVLVLDRFVPGEPGRPIRLLHLGDIPADPAVRQAIMRRQLLMQTTPSCPAGLAMAQLAAKIEETVLPKTA